VFVGLRSYALLHESQGNTTVGFEGHQGGQTNPSSINTKGCDPNEGSNVKVELLCEGMKFKEDFMIIALDGFDTILSNIFLDAYHIDILRNGIKLKIRARLTKKLVTLEVDY
jgi:hypothetical protein